MIVSRGTNPAGERKLTNVFQRCLTVYVAL